MKKKIFIIIGVLLLLLTGCTEKENVKTYQEIKLDALIKKVEAKEDFIVVLASKTCVNCKHHMATLNDIIKKYDLTIYYFDGDGLETEERAKLAKIVNYEYTPTTVYFKKGVAESTHDRLVGAVDYDKIIKYLQQRGYIGK